MVLSKRILLLFFLFSPLFLFTEQTKIKADTLKKIKEPSIRILIAQGTSFRIRGNRIRITLFPSHRKYHFKNSIRIKISHGSFHLGKKRVRAKRLSIRSEKGSLSINKKFFHQTLRLYRKKNKIFIVEKTKIEEYLQSVLQGEISSKWDAKAIQAQCIVSRSYAYYRKQTTLSNSFYDLEGHTGGQMYLGKRKKKEAFERAIQATRGWILTYHNQVAFTPFHACCGGKTEDDRWVWEGEDLPYLISRSDTFCQNSPYWDWTWETSFSTINHLVRKKRALRKKPKVWKSNLPLFTPSGRVVWGPLSLDGYPYVNFNKLRLSVGPKQLRSTRFVSFKKKNSLIFHGHGWGHGVGLCQWGAKGRAEAGWNAKKILSFYYPGTQLKKKW